MFDFEDIRAIFFFWWPLTYLISYFVYKSWFKRGADVATKESWEEINREIFRCQNLELRNGLIIAANMLAVYLPLDKEIEK